MTRTPMERVADYVQARWLLPPERAEAFAAGFTAALDISRLYPEWAGRMAQEVRQGIPPEEAREADAFTAELTRDVEPR